MNAVMDQLIREAGDLPPMPQVAQKALSLIRSPDSSAIQVAEILSVDQVLTGLVLSGANSAFYGMKNHVITVQNAITVLGMNAVRELILASSVVSYLYRPLPGYELRRGELWRHSLGVAIGARTICEWRNLKIADEAYYAGLMCDIGKLAFERLIRGTDTLSTDWLDAPFTSKEREIFGFDHCMVGTEMARRWGLPEVLINVIANHHMPSNAGADCMIASAVHVADVAIMMLGIGIGKDGLRYEIDPTAVESLKITQQDLLNLFDVIMNQIQMAELFISKDPMV
jgi:putative nucleotidyltransferase with HDIG domain